MHILVVVKGTITAMGTDNVNRINKNYLSRIMLYLYHAYQKSITH